MNNRLYLNSLFDIYQDFLTEHEKLVFQEYYQNDLSLKEIADNLKVSRSAIHNTLKIVSDKLLTYENKLKIYHNKNVLRDCLNLHDIEKIKEIITKLCR